MKTFATLLALGATPLAAQEVLPCDPLGSAQAIAEPWEDHTRTFANGDVRVAVLDTIEPALGSYYLLVLSPPYDELGGRQCRVIGFHGGMGFTTLDIGSMIADYDPARGLVIQLLGRIADPEYDFTNTVNIWVTLNQSTGEITTFSELGSE